MKFFKLSNKIFVLKLIILHYPLYFFLIGCSAPGAEQSYIDLSGKWKLIPSDSMQYATPEFNDKAFNGIEIPGHWNRIIKKNESYSATVWLRKKVFINKKFKGKLLRLNMGRIYISDETYFNGNLIGMKGSIPSRHETTKYTFNYSSSRTYSIPASYVRINEENVIAVRVYSHIFNGINGNPLLSIYDSTEIKDTIGELIQGLIRGGILAIDCILLIFFIILLRNEKKKSVLLSACSIIIVHGLLNLISFHIISVSDMFAVYKIILILILSEFFLALIILHQLFHISIKIFPAIAAILYLATVIVITFSRSSRFLVENSGPLTLIIIFIFVLYCFGMVFYAVIFKDPLRYIYYIPFFIPIVILVIYNMYRLYNFQLYKITDTALSAVPILMLAVMFSKIFDLRQSERERDSLAKALLNEANKLRKLKKVLSGAQIKNEPRDVVLDLVEYLDKNFFETYDRKELAKQFNLNEDYMGQVFRRITGTNISNYINKKRLEASQQLLTETDGKVIDIAYHVGFDNLTYFHRLFKQQFGCTPNEYRKINSKNHEDNGDGII